MTGCSCDGIATGIMAISAVAAEGPPISGLIAAAPPFHAAAGCRGTARPTTAALICTVDQRPARCVQEEYLAAVVEGAGVNLMRCDVVEGAIITALEQKETVGGDDAGELNIQVTAVRELPAIQCDRAVGCVEQFDPFIAGRVERAGPGDFIN